MRDFDIDSDLKQEKFQSLKLVQGDRGNKIKINVYEDGQPVNLAGCSITAKYKRADGEIINDGVIENIHDNSFDAVMDSSITKVAGTLKMLFTIEKDAVKVSAFLLLADVREGIGESSSSGGSAGGGEVTVDLSDYYKKIETYSRKEIDAQFKDIANLSLTKHTDGKVYIKKQDGTLIGDGIEIGGSDVDLSKITMSMSGQTLKLLNDGTQIATVEIPTAVVTDEQLTSIIQSKIDDGTLASLALGDNSVATNNIQDEAITESKVSFMNKTAHEEVVNNYDSNKTNWGKTCSNGVDLTDYSSTDFGLTDYIEIIPNTEITINYVQKGLSDKVWYYDKNKSLLGNITINSTTNVDIVITVTDTSAKYIRFMAKKDATKSVKFTNITYTYKLKKDLLEKGIESNIETMVSIDMYNAETCVDGLLGGNGTITNISGFKVTDYVEIIPNTEIITAWGETGWPCGICYYDENKQFLGSMKNTQQGSNTFIITDENAKYIRYSVQTTKTQYLIVK